MIDKLKKKIKQFKNSKYLSSYLLNAIFNEINDILSIFEKNINILSAHQEKVNKIYSFTLGIISYEIEQLLQMAQNGRFYKLNNPYYMENVVVAEDAIFLQPDIENIVAPIEVKDEKIPEDNNTFWINDDFHKLTIKTDMPFICRAYAKYNDDVYYKLIYTFNKQYINRIYIKTHDYQEVELYINNNYITTKRGNNIIFILDNKQEINTISFIFRTMPYESTFVYPINKNNIDEWIKFIINKLLGKKTNINMNEGEKIYVYNYSLDYIEFIYSKVYSYKEGETLFTFHPNGININISGEYNDPHFGILEVYIESDNAREYIPFANYVGRVFNKNELNGVYNYYEEEIIGSHILYENCVLSNTLKFDTNGSILILKNRGGY